MKSILRSISAILTTSIITTCLFASVANADIVKSNSDIVFDKENIEIAEDATYCEDHINVITKTDLPDEKLTSLPAVKDVSELFSGKDYKAYKVFINEDYDVTSAINELNEEKFVLYAEPDYSDIKENGISDIKDKSALQWHHDAIHTFDAWEQLDKLPNKGGRVRVAVIDGVFNLQDPDIYFNVNMVYSCDFSTGVRKGVDWYSDPSDHANFCASLIGANPNDDNGTAGIASGTYNNRVELVCISVTKVSGYDTLNYHGATETDISAMAEAIVYASESKCKICSISLELTKAAQTKVIELAVDTAYDNGMLLVSASGNTGTSTVNYPACCSKAVSVGNLYVDATGKLKVSPNSSYGKVDISAPGSRILSADAHYTTSIMTGTSMAAPIVAGVIALVMSVDSRITPFEAYEIVKSTAIDVDSVGYDAYSGYGCVNAYEAVREAVKKYAPSYLMNKTVSNDGLKETPYNSPVTSKEVTTLLINTLTNIQGFSQSDYSYTYIHNLTEGNVTLANYFSFVFSSSKFWNQAYKLDTTEFISLVFKILYGEQMNANIVGMINYVSQFKVANIKILHMILSMESTQDTLRVKFPNMPIGDFSDPTLFWNKYNY